MKLSAPKIGVLAAIVITIIVVILFVPINGIRAKSQLNEGVSAFRDRKYDDAEKHARRALELDPNNGDAPLLLAASLQAQYRRSDLVACYKDKDSDVNTKRATEAIELFQKMAAKDPNDDKLFKAVAGLYDSLALNAEQQIAQAAQAAQPAPQQGAGQPEVKPLKCNDQSTPDWTAEQKSWEAEQKKWTDARQKWVEDRANSPNVDPAKRAEAYLILASKNCECSKGVTDANKQNVQKPDGSVVIEYKPAKPEEYTKASECVADGLNKTDAAIKLFESATAYEQKYCLLLERGKLAKMKGEDSKPFEDEATKARDKVKELHDKTKPASTPPAQPAG